MPHEWQWLNTSDRLQKSMFLMSIVPVLLWTLGYSWTSPQHRIQIERLCIQHSRCHNFDLTRCPASSIQTTITQHFELEKIDFPSPLSVQALDFSSKRSYITFKRTTVG